MKQLLAALAVMIGLSSAAHAGILIEPYLGYEFGDLKTQTVSSLGGVETTDKVSGVGYGLRLGYKFMLPWVALDYTAGSGTVKHDSGPDDDGTQSSLGAVVGVDLPLIRAWAGYGFSNELKAKSSSSTATYKGNYMKAGVGLGFIPLVSVNVEYQINDFKKIDLGSGEVDRSTIFDTMKFDTVMVSVSIPFNL